MYGAICACLLAGFLATIVLTTFSFLGRWINVELFRSFGAYLVSTVAMRIAGFEVPGFSDVPVEILGVTIGDRLHLISYFILMLGLILSFQKKKMAERSKSEENPSKSDFSVKSLFFLMVFLLILPAMDGNIFSLSATHQLNLILNPLFIPTVALTIISGPGSWALSAQIGSVVGRRRGIAYAATAGVLGTLAAVGATILGQLISTSLSMFVPIAAVAVLMSSIMIQYGAKPKGGLSSIPLVIIAFASVSIIPLSEGFLSVIIVFCITIISVVLMGRVHGLSALIGFTTAFALQFLGLLCGLYGLPTLLPLVMLTAAAYMFIAFVDVWGSMIEKIVEMKK